MRTLPVNVFTFEELTDTAKEKAREWWRDCENQDSSYHEFVYEDCEIIFKILGIDSQKQIKLCSGKTRTEPAIWYSGFSCQGDGACFEGRYNYQKGAPKKIREHAPQDNELHRIADELQEIQRKHFYRIGCTIKHSGHYYHKYCTDFSFYNEHTGDETINADTEKAVTELMRDLMQWIYKQLEAAYEFSMSDENVDESIRINEYEFTESGSRCVCI